MSGEYKNLSASMPNGVEAFYYDTVTSTNDVAREKAMSNHQGPVWIGAAAQSAGRGRMGREWISEVGNLYASQMIRPYIKPDKMMILPFLVALSVRQALVHCGAPQDMVTCKWPNDILFNEKKIAGILIESSIGADGNVDFLIIGIGTNLNSHPEDAEFPATNFAQEVGEIIEPSDFLAKIAEALDEQWQAWLQFGNAPIRNDWLKYSWGMGEKRRIRTSNHDGVARLVSLDSDGALIIKLDDGSESRLYAGDVFPSNGS